jgi:predicted lipoprotein with Yx(FWY)xxD motif
MTMNIFMPDNMGAPTSTDACAQAWPPLLVDDPSALAAGEGIDASLLATADHPAGGTQVTYGGWPLYYFAGDSAPGDTNGQGSGDVWFALDAAGQPIP